MPELPEVEITRRALAPHLVGARLEKVEVLAPKLRQPTPLGADLEGRRVLHLTRRAKYMLADLDDEYTLLIHLGMSGRFSILPHGNGAPTTPTPISRYPHPPRATHDHAVFSTPTAELRFNDPRRFGLLLRLPTQTLENHPLLASLGPEPLEQGFSGTVVHQALRGKSTPLKVALMNPTVVVGVGNIYASESLYRAGLHPARAAGSLKAAEAARLAAAIQSVLHKAIEKGGSTLRDYRAPSGEAGHFQDEFAVYGRKGQPCLRCETPILHSTQAQRSTYWCPTCQAER